MQMDDKDRLLDLFASRVREELKKRDEQDKALVLGAGIPGSNISTYISGRPGKGLSECGIYNLLKIADYFGVSTDYLLGRTPVRAPDPDKAIQMIQEYTHLSEAAIDYLHTGWEQSAYPLEEEALRSSEIWNRMLESEEIRQMVVFLEYGEQRSREYAGQKEHDPEKVKTWELCLYGASRKFSEFLQKIRKEQREEMGTEDLTWQL